MISNAYAQATTGGVESGLMSFLPLLLMFAVLYFIMLRPQLKRQKEVKMMLSALAVGDEIVTAGGLLGVVTKVSEQYVSVRLTDGTDGIEVKIQKAAVTAVLPKGTLKSI